MQVGKEQKVGCKRADECEYLDVRQEQKDNLEKREYNCIRRKSICFDKNCVITHVIQNRETYLCLNC